MKIFRRLALILVLLASCSGSKAITNTMIAVSGTNIVLSWPSEGYESYLIQYRQTLDATDSWSQLENAYPANSTNLTTFTLCGLVSPPPSGGSGGGSVVGPPPAPSDMAMVAPADGSGSTVPLALYPPGTDLTGFNIFDPSTQDWISGSGYSVNSFSRIHSLDGGGSPMDVTNDPINVTTGFYRVFHIPDWLVGFDGYTFDGPTFLPVDYAAPDAPTNYVDSSTVLINGQPTDNAMFLSENIGGYDYWGLGIYFDRLPNGTNTLQLITSVRQSDTLDGNTSYMIFSNAPQSIVVGNLVNFTNWDDLVWNNTNYTMRAQCSVTNVDWEIDIYDVDGYYVNSQTGHSDDGSISWTWDLTDYTGATRNDSDEDPDFYPYVTITPSSGSLARIGGAHPDAGGGTSRPMPAVAKPFPSLGGWIVAYLDNFYDDGSTNYVGADSYMNSGLNAIVGAAAEWSFPVHKIAIAYGRTYAQTNRDASWNNLASWLYYSQTRNFYYFGHGAPNSIGGDENTVDSSNNITGSINLPGGHAYLTSQTVHDNVAFNQNGARPYRFVFLDGCNTANGNWPDAFGIPKQALTGGWYFSDSNTRKIRPSAFMGWNVEVGGSKEWGHVDGFWKFREYWISDWANTEQEVLDNAIDIARDTSGWVAPAQVTSHLIMFGDTELEYLQYNYGDDWPQ